MVKYYFLKYNFIVNNYNKLGTYAGNFIFIFVIKSFPLSSLTTKLIVKH